MKETKKNTVYQTPKVTVVSFLIEKGFNASLENITEGQDISGDPTDQNALVRWQ